MRGAKLILALQALAFWPVLRWYWLRVGDGSDEPWGLLALGAAIYFLWRDADWRRSRLTAAAPLLTAGYILSYSALPPLGHAVWAALAVLALVTPAYCGRRFHAGLSSLVFLSLPIVASLQFFLGYPLRVLTAAVAAFVLRIAGLPVFQEGAMLRFNEKLVWVDAPCSGIKMLWMGSFFAAVLICAGRIEGRRAMLLSLFTGAAMFAANVIRSTFLFFLEVFLPGYPAPIHSLVGVLAFFSMSAAVYALRSRLAAAEMPPEPRVPSRRRPLLLSGALAAAVMAAGVPLFSPEPLQAAVRGDTIEWPQSFRDTKLVELPLSEREQFFASGFPGAIRRFKAGETELVIRYVTQATRKLHPATDCFKGIGYRIEPAKAEIDEEQRPWSCSIVEKGAERLKVCEQIRDEKGNSWPDVSGWYWSALWNAAGGPYWAVTTSHSE